MGLKSLKTLFCLKVFPKVLLIFFGFLLYFWFSRRFFWFFKNLRENPKTKNNKPISKGGSETFKHLFSFFVFPKVFLIFFGFLWYFWFSRTFFGFSKNLRENQKTTKQTYPSVGLKPLTFLFFWFSRRYFWFSLVFFSIFGFPEAFSRWSRCLGFRY